MFIAVAQASRDKEVKVGKSDKKAILYRVFSPQNPPHPPHPPPVLYQHLKIVAPPFFWVKNRRLKRCTPPPKNRWTPPTPLGYSHFDVPVCTFSGVRGGF